MKEIKAYVHRNRVADVIAALKVSQACQPGARWIYVTDVVRAEVIP